MNAVLLWSGGLESSLLLHYLKSQVIDILQFRGLWTKEQRKLSDEVIKKHDLKVFDYAPQNISFVGENDEITAIFEYAFGGQTIPVLRDIEQGTSCIADLTKHRMTYMPIQWDLAIVGSRKDDTHYVGKPVTRQEWTVGSVRFIAPLFDWTREMVEKEAQRYGITGTDSDLHVCHNCLDTKKDTCWCPKSNGMIPTVQWNPEGNLDRFRMAYSL